MATEDLCYWMNPAGFLGLKNIVTDIFVLFTTPQFAQLYKWVPGYRRRRTREWLVFAPNCCVATIHPIHAAAMFNRMRGMEGKYAQHYVNRDVT